MSATSTLPATLDETYESPGARAWRRLKKRRTAMVALVLLVILAALAIFAPLIATHDPTQQSWRAVRQAPSLAHWFGSDEVGRDIFSRVVYGTRASLSAGVISVAIASSPACRSGFSPAMSAAGPTR